MERIPEDACWVHVYVCTNERAAGGLASCGAAEGKAVWRALRQWVTKRRWHTRVYVTQTACMGWCNAKGTTVAFHPDGAMYHQVLPEDCEGLAQQHIEPAVRNRLKG